MIHVITWLDYHHGNGNEVRHDRLSTNGHNITKSRVLYTFFVTVLGAMHTEEKNPYIDRALLEENVSLL